MGAGLLRGALFVVAVISGHLGDGDGLTTRAWAESITAGTYNIRVAVRSDDIDYWIDTRRHQVFQSITANQPDFLGFQEAYARRANGKGVTQQMALGQLFEGTKWRFFSWESENVFNMNPFIVNTDRFLPVDNGSMTVDFEEFLGPQGWRDFFDLHAFFHGDENGNTHYLGPERYVTWVVADDLADGGRVAFLTSHYETFIGENRRGQEYDKLFEYWSGLVNSSFGYASERIHSQAELLESKWGDLEVIICGDFETPDPQLPAQRVFEDAGYVETWRFINGNGRRPTRGIDNMFVTPGGFTINDSHYDRAEYTNGASDHKPLYADVTLPGSIAVLTDLTMIDGVIISGGLPELESSDDSYLETEAKVTGKASETHRMLMRISAMTAVQNPDTIDITLEAHITDIEAIVTLFLRNFDTGLFEQVGQFTNGLGEDTTNTVNVPNAARFVRGDGRIVLRVKKIVILPFTLGGFHSLEDLLEIRVR